MSFGLFTAARLDPAIGRRERAGRALERALDALAGGAGALLSHTERGWRSITFSGSRHQIVLAFDRENAIAHGEAMIVELPDHLFEIPDHLVADAAVIAVDYRADPPRLVVTLEVLLLED